MIKVGMNRWFSLAKPRFTTGYFLASLRLAWSGMRWRWQKDMRGCFGGEAGKRCWWMRCAAEALGLLS